jgi:hypothetical protein
LLTALNVATGCAVLSLMTVCNDFIPFIHQNCGWIYCLLRRNVIQRPFAGLTLPSCWSASPFVYIQLYSVSKPMQIITFMMHHFIELINYVLLTALIFGAMELLISVRNLAALSYTFSLAHDNLTYV